MNIKLAGVDDEKWKFLDSQKRNYSGSYWNKEPVDVSYV